MESIPRSVRDIDPPRSLRGPVAQPALPLVTIELLAGGARKGRLARAFVPSAPDVIVDVARDDGTSQRVVLPAESVACVCFASDSDLPPPPATAKRLRVHLAGGRTFVVCAGLASVASPLGFFGRGVDASAAFVGYYFYSHGINAREEDSPIGEMLIDAGIAGRGDVERGLRTQVAGQNVPIGKILSEQRGIPINQIEDAARVQARKRMRIGEVLVEAGLATAADIEAALAEQKKRKGKRIGQLLVDMKVISELDLTLTLARKFHLPFVDLDQCMINEDATRELVPTAFVEKHGVIAIDDDGKTLTIAIGDPLATDVIDGLRFLANRRIVEVVATPSQLARYVAQRCKVEVKEDPGATSPLDLGGIVREMRADDVHVVEEDEQDPSEVVVRGEDRGVVALVNRIVVDAVKQGASDVHVEPNGADAAVVVRLRIDGECHVFAELPATLRSALVSRIKILAKLDISERRKPQDGKIRFRLGDRLVELRVATLPTVNGNEDVVMRILASSKPLGLEAMGFTARNLTALERLLAQPYGLLLCVGPTGSGKTTTLHSALGSINKPDTKIWTAEDPVEITQPGLRQLQVQSKIGLTFATALRAFLRADPDVIMVGEMRDEETASIAVEASLTGHLVLSTLHTNSAPETITRLLDMGLDPFSFGDALLGVLAQRLCRRLCPDCRRHEPATREVHAEMVALAGGPDPWAKFGGPAFGPSFLVGTAVGCAACGGTGYRGRVALHELLVADAPIKQVIARKGAVEEIRVLGREAGMTTLLEDGLLKCLSGATDLRQVVAVASR